MSKPHTKGDGLLDSECGLQPAPPASTRGALGARRLAVLLSCCAFAVTWKAGSHWIEGVAQSPEASRSYLSAFASARGGCHGLDVEATFLSVPNADSIRRTSTEFSSASHVAGTPNDYLFDVRLKGEWEELLGLPVSPPSANIFESGSLESRLALTGSRPRRSPWAWRPWGPARGRSWSPRVYMDTYWPLLNTPVTTSLTLTPINATTPSFTAKLIEDIVPEDITSSLDKIPAYHGMSKNGTVRGQLVYAGAGTREDFASLREQGIDCTGKIVIVNYGAIFRGSKVNNAADAGAVGIIIYTDPSDDGDMTEAHGQLPYPFGPARHPSSVQRGTVQAISTYTGDPLTPFYPAYKNSSHRLERDDPSLNLPTIPSLPISYEDAIPFLRSLNGKGVKSVEGALGGYGVEYWSGPGDDVVELVNHVDYKVTPIWNTMAVIPGWIEDEVVLVGNHNDAWVYGAVDPVSGSASVQEIVRALGILLKRGWRPMRTLVIASWDAEEYGMIGSTEFGEDHATYLKEHLTAYLNCDVSFSGTSFSIDASPSLADLFQNASRAIPDPDDSSRTLLDRLAENTKDTGGPHHHEKDGFVGALGSGSDWPVFIDHLGIASANIEFMGRLGDPAYMYHSIYDSTYWMEHYGDTNYTRHAAVAKVLGLAALRLADTPILPINVTAYTSALSVYLANFETTLNASSLTLDLSPLKSSIAHLHSTASLFVSSIHSAEHSLSLLPTLWPHQKSRLARQVREINARLRRFEGCFVDEEGLAGRPWFRNLVMAPSRYSGYGATTLPGLTEAITLDGDVEQAQYEIGRLVAAFGRAEAVLRG